MRLPYPPTMEFHISRQVRDRYQFDESLFSLSGNVIFANFHAVRRFAQKINQSRDLVNYPEQAARAGQINAMGLIDEILHQVVNLYRQQVNPQAIGQTLDWLYAMLGQEAVDQVLRQFVQEFPSLAVYRRNLDPDEYLAGNSDGIPNREIVLEELIMLWLANENPAFSPYLEFFDDSHLTKESAYSQAIPLIHAFFESQPGFGPDNQNLIDMLRSPALANPHSLTGQLEFIRQRWGGLLGKFLYRLLSSLDFIKEEEKAVFTGPGPARVLEFAGLELEPERFTPDKDWMPKLVLIAKNIYVWLDQLSKKYQRAITHLDQIPDAELDNLSRWGFTGLWMIGLWERSAASKHIKQLRGNPDAVASAYSLYDYQIAADLGGDEAYQNLHDRAWRRGIRLASDMVPNHMGIDSRWVVEHPDWFISLDYSPFPAYTFNGPNLSWDDRIGIYVEDHYFDNTDAAVVFKHTDFWSGQSRYIYHGNDGTSMPWNDTAQLNYLKPEVREAVIQTILHVARKFPVIRFDAAMTLAKKHFQRLWFPEPGSGGAIPSRAEHGMTREQFDAAMPVEFWREVVDRVAQELPDTLLLAEAFWLMEGYFVRSLGMHRVYNSAFMNMLRDEKNAEYRLVIKNTLEFDPEILKRYVNFMNNPDERTSVDQFGKGDKYFGICVMMATLPGLPMFGHGQLEGYTEKYGMEYRRAYWNEQPDGYLMERHQREIFPLLRKRYLFAEAHDFLLYDFYAPEGHVIEDVFAYSNRSGGESALVIYHNRFASTLGWIRSSAAFSVKSASCERTLQQRSLSQGLGLDNAGDMFTIFRDMTTGLEYIRSNRELNEKGLYVELEAYKYHVFSDFRQVKDNEWKQYANLAAFLNGRGVPNIDEALREIFLQPIHQPFRELVNPGFFRWVITNRVKDLAVENTNLSDVLEEAEDKTAHLLSEIKTIANGQPDILPVLTQIKAELQAAMYLPSLGARYPLDRSRKYQAALRFLQTGGLKKSPWIEGDEQTWGTLLGWLFIHNLGKCIDAENYAEISRSWIDEWLLNKILAGALADLGMEQPQAWNAIRLVRLLTTHHDWWQTYLQAKKSARDGHKAAYTLLQSLLSDQEAQQYLGVNRYQDVLWFNKESFDTLLWWLFAVTVLDQAGASQSALPNPSPAETVENILACFEVIQILKRAEEQSFYQVEKLLAAVK